MTICPDGAVNWISDSSTDYDTDGCRDVDEDDDDDNDGITDALDSCQKGTLGWTRIRQPITTQTVAEMSTKMMMTITTVSLIPTILVKKESSIGHRFHQLIMTVMDVGGFWRRR